MHRCTTQGPAGLASAVSKALVNGGSRKLVNIASTKMVKDFVIPGCARPGMTSCLAAGRPAEGGLRRGEPRDRYAVGRTGDVVEADLVTERHRGRIAAVLAANPDLEIGTGLAASCHADPDEFADAVAI